MPDIYLFAKALWRSGRVRLTLTAVGQSAALPKSLRSDQRNVNRRSNLAL